MKKISNNNNKEHLYKKNVKKRKTLKLSDPLGLVAQVLEIFCRCGLSLKTWADREGSVALKFDLESDKSP